jgi:hypothetical protein
MATTLAGLLILAMFITTSLISFRSTIFGDMAVSGATRVASRAMGELLRTEISIDSVAGDTFCSLTLDLTNTGASRVVEIGQMDVIIQFASGNNAPQRLTHISSGPVAVGEWTATTITGPFEPGILNPTESLTIEGKAMLVEPGTAYITVGTPTGVIDSIELAGMNPCV